MKKPTNNTNNNMRSFMLLGMITLCAFLLFKFFHEGDVAHQTQTINYSEFRQKAEQGHLKEIVMRGDTLTATDPAGKNFATHVPANFMLAEHLVEKGIQVKSAPIETESLFMQILISWFPMLLLIGVWVYFYRQMQGGGNGRLMGFGKSRAQMMTENKKKITFADVAGVEEAKQEVQEIVEFLKDPKKFERLGGRIPKGVLLVGPPGTGKTLLARAIAGEANVPFFSISGSDFVEMFVGVGASRVRDMFEQGKKSAPCIIFIDEIDAVGRHRGAGLGGGNDEREQTLNQLLVEMDGFESNEGIILVAATNRPDVLDPALLRPGRFDRQVVVPNPDVRGREQILKVHAQKVPLAKDVDLLVIARGTPGFSGADLQNLINESALLAARRGRRVVSMAELEEAKDKVMMGAERKSMVMKDEEKELTAYHEGGHALVAHYEPAADPIHKATIIPRGRALGMVMQLPEGDQVSRSREQLDARLSVSLAGRVAEELIFGVNKITTGASSDIDGATRIARLMVMEWGMSEKLGLIKYGERQQEVFLGHSVAQNQTMSEATAQLVDQEIRRIIDESHQRARKILTKHLDQLHLLAKALLEHETLTGDEIRELVTTGKIEKKVIESTVKPHVKKRSLPTKAKSIKPSDTKE